MQRPVAEPLLRLPLQGRRLRRAGLQKGGPRYGTNEDLYALFYAKKDGPLLIYRRGALTLAVNPSDSPVQTGLSGAPLFKLGTYAHGTLGPCSFVILQ